MESSHSSLHLEESLRSNQDPARPKTKTINKIIKKQQAQTTR